MAEAERFADRNWKHWSVPSFVDVDGVETAYRRTGKGETLLYLHGGGGTRSWLPIHDELARKFDLVAPEHPGFGDSKRHPQQDSFEDYVLHYERLIRTLDLGRVHLVGTSLGAWIAANLAIHHPERFASLTLVTPLGLRIKDEPFIDVFRFNQQTAAQATFNGRAERFAELFEQEGGLDDVVHALEEDATASLLFWNPRYDRKLDRRLQRVTVPSLVIGVDEDRVVGNFQAPRYAELLPNAKYLKLSGPVDEPSSHGLVLEQPAEVVAAIATHAVARATAVKA